MTYLIIGKISWLFYLLIVPIDAYAHEVSTDYCDRSSYTDEVMDLNCDKKFVKFKSKGLPDPSHSVMIGIKATNQQFPTEHDYQFKITRKPEKSKNRVKPEAGAIGVAVNGVPIFDPATQGPMDKKTGKRQSAFDAGELDDCGGHAGRGDDYHYHTAPVCLINELGKSFIEIEKKPIGFSMDGHPIHALGFFENTNDVEDALDECRGMLDTNGIYFYNVKASAPWTILKCFNSQPKKFAKDKFERRFDRDGNEVTGLPVQLDVSTFSSSIYEKELCHTLQGTIPKEQILLTSGRTKKVKGVNVQIFYCNSKCYGHFNKADKSSNIKGRAVYYEAELSGCPIAYKKVINVPTFVYQGPKQKYKGKQSTKK